MEFKIAVEQKYLLVISAILIILGTALRWLWHYTGASTESIQVKNLIHGAAYLWIMYILLLYFRFYKHQELFGLTAIIAIHGLLSFIFQLLSLFFYIDFSMSAFIITIAIGIAKILWVLVLQPLKHGKYAAANSLYNFGVASIVALIVIVVLPRIIRYSDNFFFFSLLDIISMIPYVFIIDFALKLKIKNGLDDMDNFKM